MQVNMKCKTHFVGGKFSLVNTVHLVGASELLVPKSPFRTSRPSPLLAAVKISKEIS